MGTRFDFDNCDALCKYCHRLLENKKWHTVVVRGQPFNYLEWKKKQLGESKFKLLEIKAETITKYSAVDLEILLSEFKKELKRYEEMSVWEETTL
jgi:hypothetical protein